MQTGLRKVKIEVSRGGEDSRASNAYVFDGAKRIGRYQVRINADGRRDVYHSDINNGSFTGRRKLPKSSDTVPCGDPAVAAIAIDLNKRGLQCEELLDPDFTL